MNGHTGTAQLLISSGADIDITNKVSSNNNDCICKHINDNNSIHKQVINL